MTVDIALSTASRRPRESIAVAAAPTAPGLSVAICTHNRIDLLERALRSLIGQRVAAGRIEILVVDNASTDATAARIASLCGAGARLRALHEPTLGLTHARNRALHAARAPYLAFLDDDEVAEPTWAARLLDAIDRLGPAPACLGGPIDPLWDTPRPEWLDDTLLGFYSMLDYGPRPLRLDPERAPLFGGNFCFARAALRSIGGFETSLGRRGSQLLSNEDVLAQRRLARAGGAVWYVPDARVRHAMPAARLTPDWIVERAWWQGCSDARMRRLENGSGLRHAAGTTLAWLRSSRHAPTLRSDSARAVARRCNRAYVAGVLREWLLPGQPRTLRY